MIFRQVHHSYSLLGGYTKNRFLSLHTPLILTLGGEVKSTNCIFKLDTIIPTLHKAILLTLSDIFWGDMVEV